MNNASNFLKSIIVAATIIVVVVLVLETIRSVQRNIEWGQVRGEVVSSIEQNIEDKDYGSAMRSLDKYRDINDDVLIELEKEVRKGQEENRGDFLLSLKTTETKLEGEVTYKLKGIRDLSVTDPGVFSSPPVSDLSELNLNSFVKLVFDVSNNKETRREQLWVIITHIDEVGFKGIIDNHPKTTGMINKGDEVEFTLDHIVEVYKFPTK